MEGIVSIDVGTTSMRAALHAPDGKIVRMEQKDNAPQHFNDGRVEQDAGAWSSLLIELLSSISRFAKSAGIAPVCLSLTAQRSSLIPIDRNGTPLHPAIMWQDRRTASLAGEMTEHNAIVYRKTGLQISPVFSALKMRWLRRERPDLWKRAVRLIGIQDWIVFLLSGKLVTDQTFGSRTNLLDLATRSWDDELLGIFEVPREKLCDLVPPGSIVGTLQSSIAATVGLPSGLPIVSAGGDQQCAALGLGLFSGKRAVTNTGTGSYLIGHSGHPVLDDRMRVSCNVSAIPGAYIVEAAVLTSGSIYRWFSETCHGGEGFAMLNKEAAQSPPGASDLILLPHFKGSGTPYWDPGAKGTFFNLSLETTRGDMARAILEGIAVEMKGSLELVENLCGRVESVSVSGGLTRSDLFNQIQSDVLERDVVRFSDNEATSRGAWMAAAVACGAHGSYPDAFAAATREGSSVSYRPDPALAPLYERQRRRAQALYEALATPDLRERMK